jgi:hypothetical protein
LISIRGRAEGGLNDGPSPVGVGICAMAGNVGIKADSAARAVIATNRLHDIAVP